MKQLAWNSIVLPDSHVSTRENCSQSRFQKNISIEILGLVIKTMMVCGLFVLSSCGHPVVEWLEEVKLLDGRVITISQSKKCQGSAANAKKGGWCFTREARLKFNLPDISPSEIVWVEKLHPLILNVFKGKLYIVGKPRTSDEFRFYGAINPPYVAFEFASGQWRRIHFDVIPMEIYDTNLLIHDVPQLKTALLTLKVKLSAEENLSGMLPQVLKRLDPKLTTPAY